MKIRISILLSIVWVACSVLAEDSKIPPQAINALHFSTNTVLYALDGESFYQGTNTDAVLYGRNRGKVEGRRKNAEGRRARSDAPYQKLMRRSAETPVRLNQNTMGAPSSKIFMQLVRFSFSAISRSQRGGSSISSKLSLKVP